ncbi:unnamed protein product [Rhodiola kirilowii]
MNCFQLPEDTIKKMHSSIIRYWWSCSTSKKPVHWVKAQILCQDKDMGGLGFKDLKCINLAFLAKQAWRIGYKPSYCWRSIVKGFELLRTGSNQDQNGNIRWTANSSGSCELSSAYKLMMRLHGMDSSQEVGCSDYSQRQKFWQAYWKLAVPRKVKIFGWRGFHNALPTGFSLLKRGLINNVSCAECGYKIETYAHIFLHCWFARATWEQLGISELSRLPDAASFADIIHYSWSQFTCRKRQLVLVTLCLLWYNRTKLKHGESGYILNELVYRATNQSRSFEQIESKYMSSMRLLYNSEFEWRKPPAGFIKINCIGIVVRDSDCNTLAVRAIKRADIHSSVICEGLGLLESFKMAEKPKG